AAVRTSGWALRVCDAEPPEGPWFGRAPRRDGRTAVEGCVPLERRRRDVRVRIESPDIRRDRRVRHRHALAADRATELIDGDHRRRRQLARLYDRLHPSRTSRAGRRLRRRERRLRDGAWKHSANDGWRRALERDQDAGNRVASTAY